MADDLVNAVRASASRLGVDPSDLLTAMSYETGGKLSPDLWGGKNNNYLGLIQFGPEERVKYGVKPGMAASDQVSAAENFLRDRGLKPGMGLLDIYSTINAGRPGLYNRSDAGNGGAPGTVADKVATMAGHRMRANAMLGVGGDQARGGATPAVAPQMASAAPQPSAPLSLAPSGGGAAPDADLGSIMQGLSAIPAAANQSNAIQPVALPPIHYANPAGLARARALASIMAGRSTIG